MSDPRFKIVRGKMLVTTPDSESEWRDVIVLYDTANDALGIQLIGESELKGYIFEVPRKYFDAAITSGKPVDELKSV